VACQERYVLTPKTTHLAMKYLLISCLDQLKGLGKQDTADSNQRFADYTSHWELNSLVALRLALKQDESQPGLYKLYEFDSSTMKSGNQLVEETSVYQ